MRKVIQILTVGLSVALLQIFAQGAQAKMKSAAALMSSPAVQAAKGIHPIVRLSGCVHQAQTGNPLSTAACKYITMNGVNYSAAVLSETPVAEFYKIPVGATDSAEHVGQRGRGDARWAELELSRGRGQSDRLRRLDLEADRTDLSGKIIRNIESRPAENRRARRAAAGVGERDRGNPARDAHLPWRVCGQRGGIALSIRAQSLYIISAMRTEESRPVRLQDYRPPDWLIETVDLDVSLHPTATTVRAKLKIKPNSAGTPAPLVLDGEELQLRSLRSTASRWLRKISSPRPTG